jgi:pyrimidine operon attenuation protein/uracil phosphoribosyltransferase
VGKNLPTSSRERVTVRLVETDGVDEVVIEEPAEATEPESRPS